jgi:hypothetical protein
LSGRVSFSREFLATDLVSPYGAPRAKAVVLAGPKTILFCFLFFVFFAASFFFIYAVSFLFFFAFVKLSTYLETEKNLNLEQNFKSELISN